MIVFCFCVSFLLLACKNSDLPYHYTGEKIKGLALVAPPKPIDNECFKQLSHLNAQWVALMPYAFAKAETGEVIFSEMLDSTKKWQWWGEQKIGIETCIAYAKQHQMKVMLKPHLWIGWGSFTGTLDFESEEKWKLFEKGYANYILFYAKIAEEKNVELLCLGTEMANFVKKRPNFWGKLIHEVKKVYHGKLTYAENWDSYQHVPFWNELDFIGIDAYFPLSKNQNPTMEEIRKGWSNYENELETLANATQKPILFTEIGYRSCDFATEKPWETDFEKSYNETIQANALQACFDANWAKKWFAGMFVWKWFPDINEHNKKDLFTPQHKLAEKVLLTNFKKL